MTQKYSDESARKLLLQLLNEGQGLAWWEIKDNTVARLLRDGLLVHRRQEPVSIFVSEAVRRIYLCVKNYGGETDVRTLLERSRDVGVAKPLEYIRKMVAVGVLVLNKDKKIVSIS